MTITGGCQCGALRYRLESFGRASICHCRMCQKAMGNFFAPLVIVEGFEWTRGKPSRFASSNISDRMFCANCGTPMALETDDVVELCIGTLDDPSVVKIQYHVNTTDRLEAARCPGNIPDASGDHKQENDDWNARVENHQHPDHGTENWEVRGD